MITKRIIELRKEKKISQNKLAKEVGVSQATISRIETGDFEPSLQILAKIARYFQIGLRELVTEERLEALIDTGLVDYLYAFCANPFCDSNELYRKDGEPVVSWKSSKSYDANRYDEINFCPQCGSDLIKECPNCGRRLEEGYATYCIRCGEEIVDRPNEEEWERIRKILDTREETEDEIQF